MKLLAVDDDPMILELLLETLPGLGYPDVTGAGSAAEAMKLIAEAPQGFDGFLLDIQMPGMTGIDLCRWLRDQPGHGQSPVLMITAMSDRGFIDQSFAAGATDYVTKPFNPQELSARLQHAQKLHEERRTPVDMPQDAITTEARGVQMPAFSLTTPFNIAEVSGVVDLLALENYLLQLGRGGMIASACFAYRIHSVERLYDSCSSEEYYYTMADVAEAIAESLAYYETFVAHAGRGGFVCVSHGHSLPEAEELLLSIRDRLEAMELQYDDGRPMPLALNGSPQMRLGLRSGPAALDQLDRALAAAAPSDPAPVQIRPRPAIGSIWKRLFRRALGGLN